MKLNPDKGKSPETLAWERGYSQGLANARAALAATPAASLTPEWLWSKLMDWCHQRGMNPAEHNALFRIVSESRKLAATPAAPVAQPLPVRSALDRFNECGGAEEAKPLERLRFFCSLAMSGQDWIDAEPFFDAVAAQRMLDEGWFDTPAVPQAEVHAQLTYFAHRMERCLEDFPNDDTLRLQASFVRDCAAAIRAVLADRPAAPTSI